MKRRYIVSYYECGLTQRRSRKFFCELIAYLYKGYVEYKLGEFGKVEITEI